MIRVYIAAAREDRPRAEALRDKLTAAGHAVASTWHDGQPLPPHDGEIAALEEGFRVASRCANQMSGSHAIVVVEPEDDVGRGVLFAAGYAVSLADHGALRDGPYLIPREGVKKRSVLFALLTWVSEDGLMKALSS